MNELAKIGGSSVHNFTQRAMQMLITNPDSTRYLMDIRFMSISCRDVHGLLKDIHRMYVYGHVWNIPKWTRLYIHMISKPDNLNKI